jgi:hypothetical protein
MRELLRMTILWAIERVSTQQWEADQVFAALNLV